MLTKTCGAEFFGLLWGTWFSITLHDVRFAVDSVYERACKIIQLCCLVSFSLVGSQFEPGGDAKDDNNLNFRILCVTLAVTRGLLCIQYAIVLFYCKRARFNKLVMPLAANAALYLITTATFGLMTLAFSNEGEYIRNIYLVWYAAMFLEILLTLAISSIWRMVSFKLTHLAERLALLTLIVIGEGAIGVTKTVSMILGKGLDAEYFALIFVIVLVSTREKNSEKRLGMLILVQIITFLFMLHFDNVPKGRLTLSQLLIYWCALG